VGIGGGGVLVAWAVTTVLVNPSPRIKKKERTCQAIHDYKTHGETIHAKDVFFNLKVHA